MKLAVQLRNIFFSGALAAALPLCCQDTTITGTKPNADARKAGKSLGTNVLFPLRYSDSFLNAFPLALDLAFSIEVDSRRVWTLSANANQLTLTAEKGVFPNLRRTVMDFNFIGLRFTPKKYFREHKSARMPSGFYHAPYILIQYAERHENVYERSRNQETYTKVSEGVPGQGVFIGIGYSIGATLRMSKWYIEPNLGLGFGSATGNVLVASTPGALINEAAILNSFIQIIPTHFEIHLGREF
jgi:hypothetical protein